MRIYLYIAIIAVCGMLAFCCGGLLYTSIIMNQEKMIAQAKSDAVFEFIDRQPLSVIVNLRIQDIPRSNDI